MGRVDSWTYYMFKFLRSDFSIRLVFHFLLIHFGVCRWFRTVDIDEDGRLSFGNVDWVDIAKYAAVTGQILYSYCHENLSYILT